MVAGRNYLSESGQLLGPQLFSMAKYRSRIVPHSCKSTIPDHPASNYVMWPLKECMTMNNLIFENNLASAFKF